MTGAGVAGGKVNGKSVLGCGEASGQGKGEVGAEEIPAFQHRGFWEVPFEGSRFPESATFWASRAAFGHGVGISLPWRKVETGQ